MNDKAEDAATAANLENVNQSLDELAQIAARLGPFGNLFKTAQKVAREEKKELLIPRLAASAAQALELFTVLHHAADTMSEQLDAAGEAKDLADVKSVLDSVLNELNRLRDATRKFSTN